MKHILSLNDFLNENSKIIDYVLDKINLFGIESLTFYDKKVLDGIYVNNDISVSFIKNRIFMMIAEEAEKENILDDIEDEFETHSYYILPIYQYCKKVYDNVDDLFHSLDEHPNIYTFFEYYVSYNTDVYNTLFKNQNWIIQKAFKESFESEDIYFDTDEEYDKIASKIKKCFKI